MEDLHMRPAIIYLFYLRHNRWIAFWSILISVDDSLLILAQNQQTFMWSSGVDFKASPIFLQRIEIKQLYAGI